MAARLNKRHQAFVREKIRASQLINRLEDHALGNLELSSTQIKAIEILLKKIVPDLSAIQHSGEVVTRDARELTRDELLAIASGRGEGVAASSGSDPEPHSTH